MTANTIISNSSRRKRMQSSFPVLSECHLFWHFGFQEPVTSDDLHGSAYGAGQSSNWLSPCHPALENHKQSQNRIRSCANSTQNMTRTYANQWTTPYLTVSTVRGSQRIRRSSGIRASNYCVELNFTILCARLTGCKPMEECILHLKELQSLHHKLLWNPFGCFPAHGSEFCTSEGSDNFSGLLLFSVQDETFPKNVTLPCFGVVFWKKCLMLLQLESGRFLDETKKIHWRKVQVYVNCLRLLLPIATHQRVFPMDSCDAPLRKNWSAARILFLILMSPTSPGHQSD